MADPADAARFTNYYQGEADRQYRNRLMQQNTQQQGMENQRQNRLMDMREQEFGTQQRRTSEQDDIAAQERERQSVGRSSAIGRQALKIGKQYGEAQANAFLKSTLSIPAYKRDMSVVADDYSDLLDDAIPWEQKQQHLQSLAALGEQAEQWADEKGPRGTVLQRNSKTGELRQVVAQQPAPPVALQARFRTMTPEEIAQSGLPAGTAAQINEQTGDIEVLSKRDATGGLSQKDMTTARMKLNTLALARQQLANIRDRFGALRGSWSAGPGGSMVPSEGGRAFDRSVDQMRSTLTALTRVPGVGAMSDYETKLDQAKFPKRGEYERVTEQQIADLEQMLSLIEGGYTDLLGGGAAPAAGPSGAPASSQGRVVDFGSLQ